MIKKRIAILIFLAFSLWVHSASAMLSMELTRGIAGAIPIAIVPFAGEGDNGTLEMSTIISTDLQNSGRFKVYGRNVLTANPTKPNEIEADYFRRLGTSNVVVGSIAQSGDSYKVTFYLVDTLGGEESSQTILLNKTIPASGKQMRALAHFISDLIYKQLTGVRGVFSTKLAYVVVQRNVQPTRYILEVADQDGYNPRPLLNSTDPIMSPAWSPDGKQIAYVSFENQRAAIFVQDLESGGRRLISAAPGINGAPAWSPDGRKLALVLSKTGTPNIYVMDLGSKQLRQYTNDFYINTEPAWAPDGRTLLFTSNRSGNPQIYQLNLATGASTRVSYGGNYNARASFTADGSHIVFINRESGIFNIAALDLDTGSMKVLTTSGSDSDSPSVAPNGSMILFDTIYNGQSVLAMVSTDGRVQLRLPSRNGEAQDPAWSPFLS